MKHKITFLGITDTMIPKMIEALDTADAQFAGINGSVREWAEGYLIPALKNLGFAVSSVSYGNPSVEITIGWGC